LTGRQAGEIMRGRRCAAGAEPRRAAAGRRPTARRPHARNSRRCCTQGLRRRLGL